VGFCRSTGKISSPPEADQSQSAEGPVCNRRRQRRRRDRSAACSASWRRAHPGLWSLLVGPAGYPRTSKRRVPIRRSHDGRWRT